MQVGVAIIFFIIWMFLLWFGAIGLQATGLEPRKARFQALSALTGTGFTTREAEEIVGHPRRRGIASWLMFFGNAGIILFVILLLVYLGTNLSSLSPAKVGMVIGPIIVVLALIWSGAMDKLSTKIANLLKRTEYFKPELSSREIIHQAGDYSITRLTIGENSPEVGSKISDTSLAKHNITILAIERGERTLPFPEAKEIVLAGDHLLCYGKTDEISEASQK
jgi:ABC-type multidrug transport system fused ATPase/permease subunit